MPEGSAACPSRSILANRWHAGALHQGAMARLLWPVAQLYGALSALRRWLYARNHLLQHHLPVPVIVVGNLVVGGAGKTPTTIALVRHLRDQGWRPGVVSRGYGREGQQAVEVTWNTPPATSGDEPALIHRSTGVPVFVARERVEAARTLLERYPDVNVLVCDDGLQHLALARDIAIAVFDDRGIGNGWLLPAGLLREPWPPAAGSTANRPDLLLRQSRVGHELGPLPVPQGMPRFVAQRQLAEHAVNAIGERIPLAQLRGQPLTAVAGIARPDVFFDMLRDRGLTLQEALPLADHATPLAFAGVLARAVHPIVCTEKDAVKLFALAQDLGDEQRPVWAVPLELHLEPGFFAAIDDLLARRCHAEPGRCARPTAQAPDNASR